MGHIDEKIDFINGDTGIDRPAPKDVYGKERKTHINISKRPACGIRGRKIVFAGSQAEATCGLCKRVVAR